MLATDVLLTLTTAVVVFVSTNVDDIVLLSVLFADPKLPPRAIVIGQFLGIGTLVVVSAAAAAAAVAIPARWISLLGAFPLLLGLVKLVGLIRTRGRSEEAETKDSEQRKRAGRSAVLSVVGVTVANGADNLSVYIPLFAADRGAILIYVCVFAGLTGVWCWLGHRLVTNRVVGHKLQRYGHVILPIVLIALGIHILSGICPETRH